MIPEVEFFAETVDGIEYLNVGLQFEDSDGLVRAVLGTFQGEVPQEALVIIKGLVEQACIYVLGLDDE